MAKFFKSIFTSEKKSFRMEGDEEEDRSDFTPPLDGRRKMSISRSGRMRQANKKRHSLCLELYGENDHPVEKPKSVEYHVNKPDVLGSKKPSVEQMNTEDPRTKENIQKNTKEDKRRNSVETIKTPEEEIESAFEVIDKAL